MGTARFGAERSDEGVGERAAFFFNSYHRREDFLLAFHNDDRRSDFCTPLRAQVAQCIRDTGTTFVDAPPSPQAILN
jgi:hypothetical protein